ncbi:hypothetical protein GCM10009623_37960 [Nocardioides aestuarii]|uniref:Uncharacterized protein n=1 Tax=Nocardioides aestuarii TaxID=252231 RepID=A0ABW4TQV2_9ACTN
MSVSHTPAPARSDVATATSATGATRPFLVHGRVLTAGALAWTVSILAVGQDPHSPLGLAVFGIGSGLFQVGVMFLLRVLWRTNAIGSGRVARTVLRVEAGVLSLAMLSTFVDAIGLSNLEQTGWLVLDLCWPLSMLGMFLIGVRIAIAGRWHGLSRFWPMVAESWAVVTVPAMGIFGATVGQYVGALHLVVGYAVLGVLVSRKQG